MDRERTVTGAGAGRRLLVVAVVAAEAAAVERLGAGTGARSVLE